jgi:lariat debranching enzyme
MLAAVFGDVHGKQDLMYQKVLDHERDTGETVEVVLQVGDFETIRDEGDFEHYYAPSQFHHVSDFAGYCSGEKQAPCLTVFIGGNHENWGFLKDYSEGGFVAPDIYYLGRSGVLEVKGKTIAGITGVFKNNRYKEPKPEHPCYDWKYYTPRDVGNLMDKKIDALLLHDWFRPLKDVEISEEANIPPQFKKGYETPTYELVKNTNPAHVFMGHMHRSYLEGELGNSKIHGLSEVTSNLHPSSYRFVEI